MSKPTPLREFLERSGKTAESFAAEHQFSPWSVRHWARGDKRPNLDAQVRMAEATAGHVSPEAWLAWAMQPSATPAEQQAAA